MVEWEERHDDDTKEYHAKKKLIDFKQTVFVFPEGGLQPGDYTIGFEFMLPLGLPASMHFDQKQGYLDCEAKVTYKVITHLCDHSGNKMEYKSMILVQEPPVEFIPGGGGKWEGEVSAYCGSKKGKTTLHVQFDKNVFYSNEVAHANIVVDNSKCEMGIKEVEFEIE